MDPRVSRSGLLSGPPSSVPGDDSAADTDASIRADRRALFTRLASAQAAASAPSDAEVLSAVRARFAAHPVSLPPPLDGDRISHVGRTSAATASLWKRRVATTAALACAAAGLLATWRSHPTDRSEHAGLQLVVRGVSSEGPRSLSSSSDTPEIATFSDGSVVTVTPHSQANVTALDQHGATFSLERGALELDIIHRPDTRWRVYAGPFEVLVTGTRFVATWDPVAEQLSIQMRHGSVHVTSPCGEARNVSGSEAAEFHCASAAHDANEPSKSALAKSGDPGDPAVTGAGAPPAPDADPDSISPALGSSARLEDAAAITAVPEADAPLVDNHDLVARPESAVRPSIRRGSRHASSPAPNASMGAAVPPLPSPSGSAAASGESAPPTVNWRAALAHDNPRGSAAILDPGVLEAVLREGEGSDLIAAARSLRAAGRPVAAQDVLHTARRRFHDTPIATVAVCEMGAAYYDTLSYATAALWLDKCVTEMNPEPTEYLLGLAFDANRRAGNQERTNIVARWYVQRFPNGPYALAAKAAIQHP
jgi:ferric-dicitrate binding protein FerR (iron transport regulator)